MAKNKMKSHRGACKRLKLTGSGKVKRNCLLYTSWPCQGRRATFPRCYHMEIDGKTVAEAFSHWTLVGVEDRKILTVEDADFSRYTMGEPKNLMKGKLRITGEEAEAMETVCQKKICYSDIDCNGHMNNTCLLYTSRCV